MLQCVLAFAVDPVGLYMHVNICCCLLYLQNRGDNPFLFSRDAMASNKY